MFGSSAAPISAELSTRLDFKNQVWIKAGGRTTKTLACAIGVDRPSFSVGYAYNGFVQDFNAIIPATHNINLVFRAVKDPESPAKRFQFS